MNAYRTLAVTTTVAFLGSSLLIVMLYSVANNNWGAGFLLFPTLVAACVLLVASLITNCICLSKGVNHDKTIGAVGLALSLLSAMYVERLLQLCSFLYDLLLGSLF